MVEMQDVLSSVKETFFKDSETEAQLLQVKKDIVKEYIDTLKKDKPVTEDVAETLEKYLINEGGIKDAFKDIFRWCRLGLLLPESIDNLNKVRDKISSMKRIPTSEELSALKSEILGISIQVQTGSADTGTQTQESQSQSTTQTSNPTESGWTSQQTVDRDGSSTEMMESENKFINSVYKRASQYIWKKYTWWWISPKTWFDCSGLRYWAFKEEWIKFSKRLTAHAFSDADVDLKKEQVKQWDFMFWDQKPGSKKHNSVYHIEMVISKPYTKNWKTYVRTLWSSGDAKDDCGNYVGNWVQVREREMKDYRHYWRPTYYYQLAQHEKTWSTDVLSAWASKPSSDLSQKVLSA